MNELKKQIVSKIAENKKYKDINLGRIYTYSDMIPVYRKYSENYSQYVLFFGLSSLDTLLEGVRAGDVCTIISPTNTGKTALLLQMIKHQAKTNSFKNKLLLNFTLELSESDLCERLAQAELKLNSNELTKLKKDDSNFNIIETIKMENVIPYCFGVKDIFKKEIGAVVIDYLQLIQSSKGNEYERLSENMRKIKEIALSLNVPVILTSQISRSAFNSENGLSLTSGKGSGSIEESSQILLSLERLKENNQIDPKTLSEINEGKYQLMRIKILKKKRGRYGEVLLLFNNKNLTFSEYVKPL